MWKRHWTNTWQHFVGKIDDSFTSIQHYSTNSCQHLVNSMVEKQGIWSMISFPTVRTWPEMWEETCSWNEIATRWKQLLWEQEISSVKRVGSNISKFFSMPTYWRKSWRTQCFFCVLKLMGKDFSTPKGWMLLKKHHVFFEGGLFLHL